MNPEPFFILHVEDDANDALFLREACRKASLPCVFEVVTDGELAIAYLRGAEQFSDRQRYPFPSLLLLDLKIPRKTGFEVLEWVKGNSRPLRRIPIVIVSSSDYPGDINRAYELGANAYMVKPVDYRAVEHLFHSITQYWGLECAKPELEPA